MSRYHHTGQNNWSPRPRSGHTREYIHGPLVPMDRPEGEPSLAAGVSLLLGLALLFVAIAAVLP